MTIAQEIKKLCGNRLWEKVYGKHRKRRQRSKGKISFEQTQKNALKEYKEFLRSLQTMGKEYTWALCKILQILRIRGSVLGGKN
jgi:hypothetical protein